MTLLYLEMTGLEVKELATPMLVGVEEGEPYIGRQVQSKHNKADLTYK